MYHKVDIIVPTRWWVSVKHFEKQVELLKENYTLVHLDQYEPGNSTQVVMTFDDGYENIFNHAFPILKANNIPFEMFICGDLIGRWNHFDSGEPLTRFCSLSQLVQMAKHGGRMQWHTKDHTNLVNASSDQLGYQLEVPAHLKSVFPEPHFQWFSYPCGMHTRHTVSVVRERFRGALSVDDGMNNDRFQLNRVTVDDHWMPQSQV